MLPLILILSLSFLTLVVMFFLRFFDYRLKNGSFYDSFFKEDNRYLTKQRFLFKKKTKKKYRNGLLFFVYGRRFLFYLIIKFYTMVLGFLKKVKLILARYFKKISLKSKNKIVSEYLRNISDYKDEEK